MRHLVGGVLFFALCASPAHAAPILWSDNGHYYDFITESRTWAQALTRSGELTFDFDGAGGQPAVSGYLVTITSANEQTFLNQHFGNSGLYWIAAGDGAVEGTWRWNAGPENGSLLTYTNWKSGEPNNALGFFQEDQAVANYSGVGLWNDWAGFASANFVVEYSPAPPVATPEPATLGLLAAGLAAVVLRRRRARS